MLNRVTKSASILFLGWGILYAQSERGSIRGTVEDATGAVLPGAKITAVSVATNIEISTSSTEAGNYNIPQLPPGLYTVAAEHAGFKKLIQENVVVQVSGVTALDLHLNVGQVSDSVTVSDSAAMLKSETSDVSVDVNPNSYNDLPLTSAGGVRRWAGPGSLHLSFARGHPRHTRRRQRRRHI